MSPKNLTIGQTLKVLWSISWRTWLLQTPVTGGWMVVMYAIMRIGYTDDSSQIDARGAPLMLLAGPVFVVFLVVQACALRWALGAKWNGFKLKVELDSTAP